MKKLFLVFSIVVSSFSFGQDYGDSAVNFEKFDVELYQRLVIEHINTERKLAGLNLLVEDKEISETCMQYAQKMASMKKLVHSGNGGYVSSYEVIMHGTLVTEHKISYKMFTYYIVKSWMDEPDHREALMDLYLTRIGVGIGLIFQHQYECVRTA